MSGIFSIKNVVLTMAGLGSAGGVTGGYLHLENQVNDLRGTNTQLSRELDNDKTNSTYLAGELERAQATIAALQTGMSKNEDAVTRAARKIAGVEEQVKDHTIQITGVNKNLGTVTATVKGLKDEVSVSDIKTAIDEGLKSTVALQYGFGYQLKDKDGNIREEGNDHHAGSGFVVAHINGGKDGGFIATNWHVIYSNLLNEDAYKNNVIVLVTLSDGKEVHARPFCYKDKDGKVQLAKLDNHDLILLKVTEDISGTVPVQFASDEPKMGEAVVVLGSPFLTDYGATRFSGTFGIISSQNIAMYRNPGYDIVFNASKEHGGVFVTKTDAVINPGNSGGSIKRISDGKIVGMPTFIHNYNGGVYNGESFGTTASTLSSDIQTWLSSSHKLNPQGQFVQVAPLPPIEVAPSVPPEDKPAVAKKPMSTAVDPAPAIAKKP